MGCANPGHGVTEGFAATCDDVLKQKKEKSCLVFGSWKNNNKDILEARRLKIVWKTTEA